MTDNSVYLQYCMIPRQLQGKVCKCLDTWLCQGIIWPSKGPYALQVVIVHKRSGEICLYIDYHKLNSNTVSDAFPLPQIDKTMQAVHSSNWFLSFDFTQGYLQLAMQEDDMKKTVLELDLQASMSLLACLLVYPMQASASFVSSCSI